MIQLFYILVTIVICITVPIGLVFLIRMLVRAFDNGVKRHFKNTLTPEEYEVFEKTYYGFEKAFEDC